MKRQEHPDLLPCAAHEAQSKGRLYPEAATAYRGEYQRDRDRIIHSTAFRRLVYKTQVFVNHEGDLYRTRLTHSLEVAQIARTVALALGLNEPLVEAISLAHDLGHTPFGHSGQDALNKCMSDYGGFEHNLQSLRVVDLLEAKYADFPGINLTYETREGILKHCSARNARELGEIGERFIKRQQPGLEAQVANLADAIAYNNHDVDDGFRAGLISLEMLREQALFEEQYLEVQRLHPQLEDRRLIYEVIRRMINYVVTDLVEETGRRLQLINPASIDEVRAQSGPIVAFSDEVLAKHQQLKLFLNHSLYKHERVLSMTRKAARTVEALFATYMQTPDSMPPEFSMQAARSTADGDISGKARTIADYIAGMTDRYAISEQQRLSREPPIYS